MSQSPEGSTLDFHNGKVCAVFALILMCLNPPKGPPSISTSLRKRGYKNVDVSQSPEGSTLDFHVRDRNTPMHAKQCLNPPKGPPSISTDCSVAQPPS